MDGLNLMATGLEEVVDPIMGRQEARPRELDAIDCDSAWKKGSDSLSVQFG